MEPKHALTLFFLLVIGLPVFLIVGFSIMMELDYNEFCQQIGKPAHIFREHWHHCVSEEGETQKVECFPFGKCVKINQGESTNA